VIVFEIGDKQGQSMNWTCKDQVLYGCWPFVTAS